MPKYRERPEDWVVAAESRRSRTPVVFAFRRGATAAAFHRAPPAAATATGAEVIAVDLKPTRLAIAKDLGAAHCVDASEGDAVEAIAPDSEGVISGLQLIALNCN